MRSVVFATAFLALTLLAAVCPPATQAAPATLTVNFQIVNPDDFWATPIKNTTASTFGGKTPTAPTSIICYAGGSSQRLTPNVNNISLAISSEEGSMVTINSAFDSASGSSSFRGIGKFTVPNNGQTVTIKFSVPHVAATTKPVANVTITME